MDRKGALAFCGLTPTIDKTFRIMGLAQYAEIYPTQEEASGASIRSPPDLLRGTMTAPAPTSPAARLEELWKRIGAALEVDGPLPSRIAEAALARDRRRATRRSICGSGTPGSARGERLAGGVAAGGDPGAAAQRGSSSRGTPLAPARRGGGGPRPAAPARSAPAERPPEHAALLAFLFGVARRRPTGSRVRCARPSSSSRRGCSSSSRSTTSGLSLGGQLDLSALADEVLFRSISLTDAGKGTLVLFEDSEPVLLERSVGGEMVSAARRCGAGPCRRAASSTTRPTRSRRRACGSPAARSASRCAISVPGPAARRPRGRRQGVAGRPRSRLHADRRAPALALRQPGGRARSRRRGSTRTRSRRSASSASSSSPPRSSARSFPATCRRVAGVEIAARNRPTRQVGGDYFDFFPLSGGRLAFLVADVSGKGVPAALLVSTVHAAVHLQIDEAQDGRGPRSAGSTATSSATPRRASS